MVGMVFFTKCKVVLLIGVLDQYPLTNGQMSLVKYNQYITIFMNHLLKAWHHLMLTHGTIWMLPHGNIIYYHTTTLCFTTWQHLYCRNPTFRRVWGWHSHSWNGDLGVSKDSQNFRVGFQGSKHLELGCSLYHWKAMKV
jgi:hypothetical protein